MPIHKRVDSTGHYYQYGESGKKYYFTVGDAASEVEALEKAKRQSAAIHASKSRRSK